MRARFVRARAVKLDINYSRSIFTVQVCTCVRVFALCILQFSVLTVVIVTVVRSCVQGYGFQTQFENRNAAVFLHFCIFVRQHDVFMRTEGSIWVRPQAKPLDPACCRLFNRGAARSPLTQVGVDMSVRRKPVNKKKSAKEFRRNVSHTKAANVQSAERGQNVMRGGWRL